MKKRVLSVGIVLILSSFILSMNTFALNSFDGSASDNPDSFSIDIDEEDLNMTEDELDEEKNENDFVIESEDYADKLHIEEQDIHKEFSSSPGQAFGSISYKKAIEIDHEVYDLYPTFDNKYYAINRAKERCGVVLTEMASKYSLGSFSNDNWMKYYDCFYLYQEELFQNHDSYSTGEYNFREDQINCLDSFFDIYENDLKNGLIAIEVDETNDIAESASCENDNLNEAMESIEQLTLLMPEDDGWCEKIEDIKKDIPITVGKTNLTKAAPNNGKFSVSKGVAYADKYAASPNYGKYGIPRNGQDCTNFVSQIKHEGGVPYYKSGQKKGWSHWIVYNKNGAEHKYSTKWAGADAFVKYYGIKSKYKTASYSNKRTAFIKFAKAVKKGDFITYDKEADGDWNHNAFVTHLYYKGANKRKSISYHGSSYLDFKVAQHTSNYNRWVSNRDNGWERLPYNSSKTVFGIVK